MIAASKKAEVVKDNARAANDTGSPEVQVALLTAKRLVAEAGLGLAPGEAFAPEAAGWLRWCFASKDLGRLEQGVDRLRAWLLKN